MEGNTKLATTALIALAVQTALFSQAAPKVSLKVERVQGKGISYNQIMVSVRVTNISPETVRVPMSDVPELDYQFTVIGPDGRPAPPTPDAEKHLRKIQFSNGLIDLVPGASKALGGLVINDVVDFSRPGTYRITATRHYDSKTWSIQGVLDGTYTSDVLEVKVP
ncbi:MAG TPA: hypothetical protein VGG72_03135 [Bryobacteraceae bacterium]